MNTLSYQTFSPYAFAVEEKIDWLTCAWGGPYDDDLPETLCGVWSCPGNCDSCLAIEAEMQQLSLPIQGPLNKDGVPLGYLLVSP